MQSPVRLIGLYTENYGFRVNNKLWINTDANVNTWKLIATSWGAKERVIMLNAHIARQKQTMFKTFKKIKTPSGPYVESHWKIKVILKMTNLPNLVSANNFSFS